VDVATGVVAAAAEVVDASGAGPVTPGTGAVGVTAAVVGLVPTDGVVADRPPVLA
jgi:hypothetical protein